MGEIGKPDEANSEERDRLITEVLELGEDLFELALTRGVDGEHIDKGEAGGSEDFPVADLRAAADEFFVALRLLLGN